MICGVVDCDFAAFGDPAPSSLHRRLARIAKHNDFPEDDIVGFLDFVLDLYGGDNWQPYDINEYAFLQEPYEFAFKGDAALVEAVFQAVGFATLLGLDTPDDGSETHYSLRVAPPVMVFL